MALERLTAEVSGTVWKIEAPVGARVAAEDSVIILESMKMEIPVSAPADGVVREILVEEGDPVEEGQDVAVLEV